MATQKCFAYQSFQLAHTQLGQSALLETFYFSYDTNDTLLETLYFSYDINHTLPETLYFSYDTLLETFHFSDDINDSLHYEKHFISVMIQMLRAISLYFGICNSLNV